MAATERSRIRAWPASVPGRGWPGAALFALVNAALAAVGHHLASEEAVPWARLLSVAAAVFLISVPGARRPCGLARTVSSTLLAQGVLHQGLAMPHPHSADASTGYAAHLAPWLMTLAHVTAAVATAVLLHRGDQRLRGLSTVMVRWARAAAVALARAIGSLPCRPLRPPSEARLPQVGIRRSQAATERLVHVVVRRGPPEALALGPDRLWRDIPHVGNAPAPK
ncbi:MULTISPECIES: hypothetical protein [Streptomyces]|uniref:hypothetical protein n=1 Tax=Streptomyces TaxID=1883 RepID=UPI002253D07E|nr:hypothetical protein [Streptomyces erythrochromogenes]MCX5582907.1 hypothetical protein [Streptomyces erythrochromogenes]